MTPDFPREFQPAVLKTPPNPVCFCVRDYHPLECAVPGNFRFTSRVVRWAYDTTSPVAGIRFELCRFRSPLLTTSRLISFPAPTEMFQFGAFPILTDKHRSVGMSH